LNGEIVVEREMKVKLRKFRLQLSNLWNQFIFSILQIILSSQNCPNLFPVIAFKIHSELKDKDFSDRQSWEKISSNFIGF
jgi:hypothetical protein